MFLVHSPKWFRRKRSILMYAGAWWDMAMLQSFFSKGLYWNSFFQLFSHISTGLTGMVFWLLAARMFPAEALGVPTSLVSTVVFLSLIAGLGVEVTLSRYFPVIENRRQFFLKLMGWSAFITLIMAGVAVFSSSFLVPDFFNIFFEDNALTVTAGLFVFFTLVRGVVKNIDGVLIAEKRSELAFVRTLVFDLTKLFLLYTFLSIAGPIGTFWAWGAGVCISLIAGALLVHWKIRFDSKSNSIMKTIPARELIQFSLVNLVAWNFSLVVGNLLPLLVLTWVGPAEATIFFLAWVLGSYLMIVPMVFSRSFLVESVHAVNQSRSFLWKTILMSFLILVPAAILTFFFGDWIFQLFGHTYAGGGILLFLFALSALFEVFIRVHFVLLNMARWNKPLALLNGFRLFLFVVVVVVLAPQYGSMGLALAWLISTIVSAGISILHLIQKYHFLGEKHESF